MLVIRYPLSLNVLRRLKASDLVKYTGRIIVLSRRAFERIITYEKAEGLVPEYINGELICFGSLQNDSVQLLEIKDHEDFLEKSFLFGVVSVLSKSAKASNFYFKRYARVMFVPTCDVTVKSFRILAHADLKNEAVVEVEVEDLLMRVAIDSKGCTKTVGVDQ
ncbi:hypothetical protein [Thermotoga profunda]|uniref:hypothetical protein n=1 Tax=Thermotoga profunda TaxID=1508420 RepID=UPI000597E905|nr:hypothetical protein [Thermotoga profunda]